MNRPLLFAYLLLLVVNDGPLCGAQDSAAPAEKGKANASPLSDPAFFPVAVWLQSPRNAARYKAACTFTG